MILITGATGFLGSHLCHALRNHPLKLLNRKVRGGGNLIRDNEFFLDINSFEDYSPALKGCDVVVHCAARVHKMDDIDSDEVFKEYHEINTLGTLNLARQAVEHGVKRFIYISTVKVNGESTSYQAPFTSRDKPNPQDFYSRSKALAESELISLSESSGLEVVIIRPTLVYGAGVKANFASLMRLVSRGLPLPFGCITNNARSLVSVKNLVDLIVTCIDHPKAVNDVFLVSDGHDVSTSEMERQMSKASGKSSFQLPVPVWCYKLVGKLLKKEDVIDRLTGSLQVDITHTKETLGWQPPQTLADGFKETADYIIELQGKK